MTRAVGTGKKSKQPLVMKEPRSCSDRDGDKDEGRRFNYVNPMGTHYVKNCAHCNIFWNYELESFGAQRYRPACVLMVRVQGIASSGSLERGVKNERIQCVLKYRLSM